MPFLVGLFQHKFCSSCNQPKITKNDYITVETDVHNLLSFCCSCSMDLHCVPIKRFQILHDDKMMLCLINKQNEQIVTLLLAKKHRNTSSLLVFMLEGGS